MESKSGARSDSHEQTMAGENGTKQTAGPAFLTTTIAFQRLEHARAELICTFLRKQDTSVCELASCAKKVIGTGITK